MSDTRDFHIGDILSVTTGRLVSPRLIGGVYDILNYMTGESLFTHQLPRVCKEARPILLHQHPQLSDVSLEHVTAENWAQELAALVARFGEHLPVVPMAAGEHQVKGALTELVDMVGADRAMAIILPDAAP